MRLTILLTANAVLGLLIPDFQTILNFKPEIPFKLEDSNQDKPVEVKPVEQDKPIEQVNSQLAPILNADSINDVIPDRYIVVFKNDLSISEMAMHKDFIFEEYKNLVDDISNFKGSKILLSNMKSNPLESFNIKGFCGYFGYMTQELVEMIQRSGPIRYIEKDVKVTLNEYEIQKEAPWGLARLSQREQFSSPNYEFDNEGGKGVTAYVIDTGIKTNLEEFEGRANWGDSFAFPKLKIDGNGHGTHCAGIIGSKTYGVAKQVELVAVGVMNFLGSGVTSDIIKGIEFVVNDHNTKVAAKKSGFKGSVINMSLGGGSQDSLDLAINAATKAGVHVAVAAGNDNQDACEYSPAKATGPITVGASNAQDAKADFSNWGKCVDIFAPGEEITSTFIVGGTSVLSGTSMAAPHIAGLLAYYLSLTPDLGSEFGTGLLPPQVLKSKIINYGTKGVISSIIDTETPNILAYNGAGQNLTDFWNL